MKHFLTATLAVAILISSIVMAGFIISHRTAAWPSLVHVGDHI